MIDIDKYEGHLADALVAVREGGVDCDFSKIRIEDALGDMADLLAEVKRLRERVKTEKNLNLWEKAEVKRLRNSEKALKSILSRYLSTEAIQFHYEKELKELIE